MICAEYFILFSLVTTETFQVSSSQEFIENAYKFILFFKVCKLERNILLLSIFTWNILFLKEP